MNETNSDERTIAHWPSNWPGRQVLDLDNLGDPGIWIEEHIPFAEEVLLHGTDNDFINAEALADAYIAAACGTYIPLPSEFGASDEETRTMLIEEFIDFICEWRKQTLAEQVGFQKKRTDHP
ncbi:hypothetical protein [Rosistilla oblonga]|uniref:hypothetical protein n=1 Tax=Rosistilla oblonga TaxID=2527990 RepID=UPI003A9727B0